LTAVAIQLYRGHAPLEPQIYLKTYAVILVPTAVFFVAASIALNVLLREKYLTYAVSLAIGGAFYYLTSQGYNHWLYNPALYQLWTPSDFVNGGSHLTRILVQRIYCLALSVFLLALALLCFERKSTEALKTRARLSGKGWTILAATTSILIAALTGLIINAIA